MPREPRKPLRRKAKQQRSQETVDTILTAAAQVLKQHSYAGATTDRIAERAGVSVGSIYQYFSGKDDVFESLFAREAERLMAQMKRFQADPERPLRENLEGLLAIGAYNPDLDPPLYRELERVPSIEGRMQDLRDASADVIEGFLRPFRRELAVSNLRNAVQLIVLCAEGIGHGASRQALDAGIAEGFTAMSVSYLLGEPARTRDR